MTSLTSPQRSHLVDQVIDQLRTRIIAGEWPVGSRIPPENELVERLGVARNTVREAIRALAHAGLVDIRQGSGTYVRTTSELAGVMLRRFGAAPTSQLRELRKILEVESARLAAGRRTQADLRALDRALTRRERAWTAQDLDLFVHTDAALHQAVVAASGNTVLVGLYADLGELLQATFRADLGSCLNPEQNIDHGRLVEEIRAGRADRAAAAAAEILDAASAALPSVTTGGR